MSKEPSTPLVWNLDNVRDVAESVGISSLSSEAVKSLAQEVEYRVGQVTMEAMRFMQAGKRAVLGTQDIAQALKVLDVEPLYGYESTRPLRYGEASLGPGQPLYYIEDEEVDFEKLINAPLPKVPRDIVMTAHWLGVEGVQPSIPQNPTTAEAKSSELVPKGPGANPYLGALAGNDNVSQKPLVRHIISKELIKYFETVVAAILSDDIDPKIVQGRLNALNSLRSEMGLHQLLPYFVQYVTHKVTMCLDDLFVLDSMMDLFDALVDNKNLYLAPYYPSMVPPVLSCMITRNLGPGNADDEIQKKYDLRNKAASLAGKMVVRIEDPNNKILERLISTFLKFFLDEEQSLATHFGALKGIFYSLTPEKKRRILTHLIEPFDKEVLTPASRRTGEKTVEVTMLIGAIVQNIESFETPIEARLVANEPEPSQAKLEKYLGPVIGSRIWIYNRPVLNKLIIKAIDEYKAYTKAQKES
ncbi:TATA box binding protein associated factor-domain-containing protein [Calycina marina]|uniref:TBP-associated factor 6 n=1 Tax=Calycina marina TaxID=1763456 RepID=A0A9P7YUH7_9HELO|nr:TATA box binding protein associated factor-domain-containing protein [Calycina marina]